MARWLFHHRKVFTIILIILSITTDSNAYLDNLNVPCKYLDSINITNGIKNTDDDSIMFEGISYPETLHATYDYEFTNESYRHSVVPHERGCICAVDPEKPCVRMCCPRGQHLTPSIGGSICSEDEGVFNMSVSVYDGDTIVEGNIFDFFNYVVGKPCLNITKLDPVERRNLDTWKLLKNGQILRGDLRIETLNKNHYCFTALPSKGSFETTLFTCFKELDQSKHFWVAGVMFLSVPFLLATIVVYIILPELRNLHGKSLVCYLCGLAVGYTTIGLIKLNGPANADPKLCRTMGYASYCAFLFAFFWLNVISFDLWRSFWVTFRNRRSDDSKRFVYYSIYAWGSTALMLSICLVIDYSPGVPSEFQPAIGIHDCFLGNSTWSELLYLYLPVMLIVFTNLTFFVLTSWKIREAQKEIEKFTNNEESKIHRKNLEEEKSNHGLFLRMFIVMGVTWSMEPISWIFSPHGIYFYPTDIMNAVQGVIIFFLFVVRVNVKNLMVKRWRKWQGKVVRSRSTATINYHTCVTTMNDTNSLELRTTSNNKDM